MLTLALGAAVLCRSAAAVADPVGRWAVEIAEASARFGIPEPWIRRVMRAESGGNMLFHGQPTVSRAGAIGLMQLMPATWRDMRLTLGLGLDPQDPAANILAGTAYLKLMYDRFGYPGLFAAYNAGPARYAAYLKGARRLPIETRAYVAAVAPPSRRIAAPVMVYLFAIRLGAAPAVPARVPEFPSKALFVPLSGTMDR